MGGDHFHLVNYHLICTIIFSLFLSFPISVESSWSCLGAQEYKTTVQQEFEQDFRNAHPNNYNSFRVECEAMNSLAVTLDLKVTAESNSNGIAELKTCGGWFVDPKYRCLVYLEDGTWNGLFQPLLPEYDCVEKNHHCWWKLHDGYLLRHSPKRNGWLRQNYGLGWVPQPTAEDIK